MALVICLTAGATWLALLVGMTIDQFRNGDF